MHRGDCSRRRAAGALPNPLATEGSRRPVQISGGSTNDITISGSRVRAGATVVTYENADLKRVVRVTGETR